MIGVELTAVRENLVVEIVEIENPAWDPRHRAYVIIISVGMRRYWFKLYKSLYKDNR